MANEHNPIALRINEIQKLWSQKTQEKKDFKLVQWLLVNENDLPLLNGFYKLESSPHKNMEDILVVMLTDFQEKDKYSFQLAKDWINEYEKNLEKYPDLPWKEYQSFQEKIKTIENQEKQGHLLLDLLKSYKEIIPQGQKLIVGIIPRKIYNQSEFLEWLNSLMQNLPDNIAIMLTDYQQNNFYSKVVSQNKNYSLSIVLPDMNMKQAYNELITQGNPNDPEVSFRHCMLRMGEAASAKNLKELYKWGDKLLDIGQSTGNKNIWASGFLIYAGFLFGFKDTKTLPLLDQGLKITNNLIKNNNLSGLSTHLQLYAYKASYYSILGKYQLAFDNFIIQSKEAYEYKDISSSIGACKNAILIAEKHYMKNEMTEYLNSIFFNFYELEEEILKATEFFFIADYFITNSSILLFKQIKEIDERMKILFGDEWRSNSFSKIGRSPSVI